MNAEDLEDDNGDVITAGSFLESARTAYKIQALLGAGGFGAVYRVTDMQTEKVFAMKIEKRKEKKRRSKLVMEIAILKMVEKERGENSHYLSIVDRAKKEKIAFIVMTLAGKSLDDLKKECENRVFSMGTALAVGRQCLEAVEDLHKHSFIHRDLKPANYACGLDQKIRTIYVLDFGIARMFAKDRLKPPRTYVGFKGTIRFAALSCHNNKDLYPKDDAESWFYLLLDISMVRGLSWRKLNDREKVKKCKEAIRFNDLEEILPVDSPSKKEFRDILTHIDDLQFGDSVDYSFIYTTLQVIADINKVSMDDPYDWEPKTGRKAASDTEQ